MPVANFQSCNQSRIYHSFIFVAVPPDEMNMGQGRSGRAGDEEKHDERNVKSMRGKIEPHLSNSNFIPVPPTSPHGPPLFQFRNHTAPEHNSLPIDEELVCSACGPCNTVENRHIVGRRNMDDWNQSATNLREPQTSETTLHSSLQVMEESIGDSLSNSPPCS